MLSGKSYGLIYLIVVILGTMYCLSKYNALSPDRICRQSKNEQYGSLVIFTILLILFIGLRPLDYIFVDMMNYYAFYTNALGENYSFNIGAENLIFDNLMYYMASFNIDISFFFLAIAAIYFGAIIVAIIKIFPNDAAYVFFIYLGAFSTFSYGTNGIKAGAAASVFLLAFAFYNKKYIALLCCLISIGLHHSMFFPVGVFWITYYKNMTKTYFGLWIMCLIFAAAHVTYFQFLFADLSDSASEYLSVTNFGDTGMKTGFRLDFILYGFIPIAVGFWAIFIKKLRNARYQHMLNTYLVTNGVWMLTMYVPFNNRIAYLSWCILPVVSIYPLCLIKIQDNQYKILNYIALIYLVFKIYAYNYL